MWLALEWGGARAALPLSAVFEILSLDAAAADLVAVPRARVSVKGVAVHRGYVVPVFDPRRWKGFFREIPASADEHLVLVETADSLDGIVVGRVDILTGIRDQGLGISKKEDAVSSSPANPYSLTPTPSAAAGIGEAFVEGALRARRGEGEEETWALLSLQRLAKAMHGE